MKIAICAALYEAGRPFLAEFSQAVRVAAAGHDAIFVAAVDGLENSRDALADIAKDIDVVTVDVPVGHTPAGVRGAMLTAGQSTGADILVFIDMDDVIAPRALDRHLVALAWADFSYGDLDLIDASGQSLGRCFFDDADVPDRVDDVTAVCDRNFLGFSNTAVWADRIAPVALIVPEDVIAADWWFFTMLLLGGLRGKKAAGAIASYRLHDANILGAGAPGTKSQAIAQSEAMLRHYRAFSAHPALAGRADDAEQVIARLRSLNPQEISAHLGTCGDDSGAWFEGIGRLAQRLDTAPLADAVGQ
ncbi:MAG: hypothetical protein GKS02_03625 [Alphaproteobacteria bacterium]|nr:hypothetical protein [Alphaproteobacteria bacterium]